MRLSRLLITGELSNDMPVCVLTEIADAHGIDYKDIVNNVNFNKILIQSINSTTTQTIDDEELTDSINFIARFVNHNEKWRYPKLMEAYKFLNKFMNDDVALNLIPKNFQTGLQNMGKIDALNCCILYKICKQNGINIKLTNTIDKMEKAVRYLQENQTILLHEVNELLHKSDKANLINFLLTNKKNEETINISDINYNIIPKNNITYKSLEDVNEVLCDINRLLKNCPPNTSQGAIGLAAKIYQVDISCCADAVREYNYLNKININSYIPLDNWMKYWYSKNRNLFNLNYYYNPLFPINYYAKETIKNLIKYEGYIENEIDITQSEELLHLAYLGDTFYSGCLPHLTNATTTIINMENIDDIANGELFSYGRRNDKLNPITVSELIDLFTNNKNFIDPFAPNSVFTGRSINKLKIMLSSGEDDFFCLDTINKRKHLLDVINTTEILSKSNDDATKLLVFVFDNANRDTKKAIVSAFNNLLSLGMYMRGWRGHSYDYPVSHAEVPPEFESQMYLNITEAFNDYDKSCRVLGKIGLQINQLPLVSFKENQYIKSTNINDGITIIDRINIIKSGDNTTNMASCVRLSSNWICASAHKYLIALSQPSPFDIFHLRKIS